MTTQLSIAIPSFDALPPEEIQSFAASNLEILRGEANAAKDLATQAAERAWAIGKACVHLKDNGIIQPDLWEEWAKENIGAGDYLPVYRSMRLFRMSPDKPPGKASAQFKQLQIMFGDEPMPKVTPRKTDAVRFSNFKASCSSIQRWWREGEVIKGLDAGTLEEILEDLKPLCAIASAVNIALQNEGGAE